MLNLSRRVGETIKIGDQITIVVLPFKSNGEVRLGIAAPTTVAVHRSEIFERIRHAKSVAVEHSDPQAKFDAD